MNRLAMLALGTLALTACGIPNAFDAMPEGPFFDDSYGGPIESFARGEHFEDVATRYGDVEGFALGSDTYGALGMVGMVCSFGTNDGELRVDVDPDGGDEFVVDARAELNGFSTLSIDGGQITVSVFPAEWDGAISVDVVPPGGDIADAAFTDTGVVVIRHDDSGLCVVERFLHGSDTASAATPLGSPCISGITTDADGTAYVSTAQSTYAIGLDSMAIEIGGPSSHLAYGHDAATLALGNASSLNGWAGNIQWSTELGGTLVDLAWVQGDRVVATVDGSNGPELLMIDGTDGEIVERVGTQGVPIRMSTSPEGGMLAVESDFALHMIRILD